MSETSSNVVISIYNLATGALRHVTGVPAGTEDDQCGDGEGWLPGAPATADGSRVDLETLTFVPLLTYDLTITTNTVSGIPLGTQVWVHDQPPAMIGPDGIIEVTAQWAETIKIKLFNDLYHFMQIEVPCAPVV